VDNNIVALGDGELMFVTVAHTAPVLRRVIDDYLKRSGTHLTPAHEIEHVAMGMTLIPSARGVGLLTRLDELIAGASKKTQ